MNEHTELERELAELVTTTLNLEIEAEDLDPDLALFGQGLGLDSIDALELAVAISKRYGFELRSDDEDNATAFQSLRTLAAHVARHRSS